MPNSSDRRSSDRRGKQRFQIAQELRYKLLVRGARIIAAGTATSLNISSSGLWFSTPNLPPRLPIEVSINWPAMLDQSRLMQLTLHGAVVRSNDEGTAVTIHRYEFRTRASRNLQLV